MVAASVGIRLADERSTAQRLIEDADLAMDAAKGAGKARMRTSGATRDRG